MTTIPIGDFLATAEAWLAARYPAASTAGRRFTWGEGDDEVQVFQEPDPVARGRRAASHQTLAPEPVGRPATPGSTARLSTAAPACPAAFARGFEQLARRYQVPAIPRSR